MDDEKWKKAVDKTEEVVFGYCALRENRKARKASRKARYRSLKQQKGRVRALLHMVGEGIIFGVYGILVDSRCDGTQTQMVGGTERKTI